MENATVTTVPSRADRGTRLAFGDFELHLTSGDLRRNGRPLRLAAQPTRALRLLVGRPGEIVTREELQEALWGDIAVDWERGITFCVNQIRSALGDSARAPRYIETIPRKGYRFLAEVRVVGEESPDRARVSRSYRWLPWAGSVLTLAALVTTWALLGSPRPVRLAVLPFEDLGDNTATAYFAAAASEELTVLLSRHAPERLAIIASSSSSRYTDESRAPQLVGRELDADYILRGSVRSDGGFPAVTTHLVRVRDGVNLWSVTLRPSSLFAVSLVSDVVIPATDALGIPARAPGMPEGDRGPEARRLYLHARWLFKKLTREDVQRAIALYLEALARAPGDRQMLIGLAEAQMALGRLEEARKTLRPALDSPADPTALRIVASIAMFKDWDWATAETHLDAAVALAPGDAANRHLRGVLLTSLGRYEEAADDLRAALRLDPVSPIVHGDLAWSHNAAGRLADAVTLAESTLVLDPSNRPALECLVVSLFQAGRHAEALVHARRMGGLSGTAQAHNEPERQLRKWFEDEAARLAHVDDPYELAGAQALAGDRDATFEALDRALAGRSPRLAFLRSDSRFREVRGDPRFAPLLDAVGLPPL